MKNLIYTVGNETIEMPQNHDLKAWETYFETLRAKKPSAPLFAVYYCYSFICDYEVATIPDPDTYLCYDTGIELCAEDRFPAYDAALSVGFIEEGVRQLIEEAGKDGEYRADYIAIIRTIFEKSLCINFIADDLLLRGVKLLIGVDHSMSMQKK